MSFQSQSQKRHKVEGENNQVAEDNIQNDLFISISKNTQKQTIYCLAIQTYMQTRMKSKNMISGNT